MFGVATTATFPASRNPVAGLIVPPVPATVVNRCWVLKFAVYVVATAGLTVCEIAPPSDQLMNTYCVPVGPACGVVVAIVCADPGVQLNTCDPVNDAPPSTLTRAPLSPLATVTAIVLAVFVNVNAAAGALPAVAFTVYAPAVAFAVTVTLATPDAFVTAVAPTIPAPVAGPAKLTVTPGNGLLAASRTVTDNGCPNAVPAVALCPDPEFTVTVAGLPKLIVNARVAVLPVNPAAPLYTASTVYPPAAVLAGTVSEALAFPFATA